MSEKQNPAAIPVPDDLAGLTPDEISALRQEAAETAEKVRATIHRNVPIPGNRLRRAEKGKNEMPQR
jgi:hypothetical protein